jgi:two-component system chemotaxis sensor kinase CheA
VSHSDPENNREFFAQFLDDYYAESDEHLTVLRRSLLLLEDKFRNRGPARALLDELFRSFHTLKGISGMVGLTEAEQLSHHLESYLRLLRQEEAPLTWAGIEALMAGTTTLETVIAARRNEAVIPRIDSVIARLTALATETPAGGPAAQQNADDNPWQRQENSNTQTEGADDLETRTWRFVFTPSVALSQQGVNVNQVRTRLQEVGEIVRSTPLVKNRGEISFEFIVVTSAAEETFAGWHLANLTYELIGDTGANVPAAGISGRASHAPALPGEFLPASAASMLASAGVVRVDLERLDDLMRLIGELVTSRARLDENLKSLRRSLPVEAWRKLQETSFAMDKQLRDLRDGVIRVRLVHVGEIFERMKFVVRDLARESGKQIRLEMSGEDTEIDKFLVERMMDPLLHLVRNAVSHGLETPAERHASNKLAEGRLTLRAATVGESILIEIVDDGRGIDIQQVRTLAVAKGLLDPGASVDGDNLLRVLCTPGFSTRREADRESGRGVGMDVVMKAVTELGGTLSLETDRDCGTRFMIQLPLTLAIAEALIAVAGGQRFAIPQSAVREVIEVEPAKVKVMEHNEIVSYRGGVLPLVRLARLFDLGEMGDRPFHVLVIGSGPSALGIAVERVMGQQEIVIRGIGDPLVQVAGIAGATELGDKQVVLILDVGGLRQLAHPA